MPVTQLVCQVCHAALPKKKKRGRKQLYCRPPKKCQIIGRRMGLGRRKGPPIAKRPKETVAAQRYREALAALAKAKEDVEAKRRGVETAEGVVEQAEIRLRDAQATAQRESAMGGEA